MKEITGVAPQELQAQLDVLTTSDTLRNLHHSRNGREHHFRLVIESDPNVENNEKNTYISTEHTLEELLEGVPPQLVYDHRCLVDFAVRRDLVSTNERPSMAIIVTLISRQSDQNHKYHISRAETDDNEYEELARHEAGDTPMIARPYKFKGKKYKLVIEEGAQN